MSAPTPKALVALCECGPIIRDLIDLDELGRVTGELPGVGHVCTHATLCSEDGRAFLAEQLRTHPDLVPVVAACTPREHAEDLEAACEAAGRNRYTLARANIREQVAWVTPDKAEATAKAAGVVEAAVARVGLQEPLTAPEIDCDTNVLVVGAGVAGMTSALMLADAGRQVTIVEREPAVGGKVVLLSEIYPGMDCAPCLLDPLMDRVLHHPDIEVFTSADVEGVVGYLGNFTVSVRKRARHVDVEGCYGCRSCHAVCPVQTPDPVNAGRSMRGAVYIPYPGALPNASVVDETTCLHFIDGSCDACVAACPFGNIDLSGDDEVVQRQVGAIILATGAIDSANDTTIRELPHVITTWEFERMTNPDGPTEGKIVLADGSVPSRIALVQRADEPSPSNSLALAKHALELAEKLPQAQVTMIDWDGAPESAPDVAAFDLIVLASPRVGDSSIAQLTANLGVDLDEAGFPLPADRRLTTFATRVAGVYIAGAAAGDKSVPDAAAHAAAATGAALSALVPGRRLIREATTAVVDEKLCGGCRICMLSCPYKSISFDDERKVASVNELLCHGCGTCAAACPSSAITAKHFSDEQVLAEIVTLATRTARDVPATSF